jgi:cholesterol oxidase
MSSEKISFQFTEDMKGYVAFGQSNFQDGYDQGKKAGIALDFRLTIKTDDIDAFVDKPEHEAEAIGYIVCEKLGGKLTVEKGIFNLFVDTKDLNRRKMKYRLFFKDEKGKPLTFSGFKSVQDDVGLDIWSDTSTLYSNLFSGHIDEAKEASSEVMATGILHIKIADFAKQLTTFRSNGATFADRATATGKFGKLFAGSLWEVYAPSLAPEMNEYVREIPLYTTEGITDADITTHPFNTADNLGLSLLRFNRSDCDDVVVIAHGLTTSSDMFIMPEHYSLVQYLLNNGYEDVWTLDYRMSNRFGYNMQRNQYNMDDIALYDFPAAIATIREQIGPDRRIHVICHCLGSVSFMMSLFAKAVTGISSVIANSVSLTPSIPAWSKIKLSIGPFLCDYVAGIEYINPYWRRQPGFSVGKVLGKLISLFHKECDVPECHMLSFMWGTGFPALYSHENLHDVTHRRGGDLYGGVSVNYYRHVSKMVKAKNTAVKYQPENPKYKSLPDNYFEHAKDIETPVLFMTGEQNKVFTNSNLICHQRLEEIVPGRHELHVFPNYGHQDVFMGKDCDKDIFPRLLTFIQKHSKK